jgi:hypothetical protein
MSDEEKDSIKIPLKSVFSRVMAVTVISKRTLARIIKEGKARQLHFQHRRNHVQEKKVAVVDAFDVDVIRRLVHNFHVTQKQRPTLNTVLPLSR